MEFFDLGDKDYLKVLERFECDLLILQVEQVVLNRWNLERLLIESTLPDKLPNTQAHSLFLTGTWLLIFTCISFFTVLQLINIGQTDSLPLHRRRPNIFLFTF